MHYAPVAPPKLHRALPPRKASFMYAVHAVNYPEYLNTFMGAENVVIDNPIYEAYLPTSDGENVEVVNPTELSWLIEATKPNFAFMPDKVDDVLGTIKLAQPYLERIASPSLAAVLQGKTIQEIKVCAREFYTAGIRRFGVSIFTPRHFGLGRGVVTDEVLLSIGDENIRFHWLGADSPYGENHEYAGNPYILSCDSAEAFNFAYNHSIGAGSHHRRKRPVNFAHIDFISRYTQYMWERECEVIEAWFHRSGLTTPVSLTMASSDQVIS